VLVHSLPIMNLLTKIFVTLAVTCGAAWLLKQVAIALTGGGDTDSPVVALLWGLGMLTFLLAAATGTAVLLARFPVWVRLLGAVVAVPAAFVALEMVDAVVDAVYDESNGWFAAEVPLVLAALAVGGLGLRTLGGLRRA
jgi:hypothetical protein